MLDDQEQHTRTGSSPEAESPLRGIRLVNALEFRVAMLSIAWHEALRREFEWLGIYGWVMQHRPNKG